jgi:hypothetical protein
MYSTWYFFPPKGKHVILHVILPLPGIKTRSSCSAPGVANLPAPLAVVTRVLPTLGTDFFLQAGVVELGVTEQLVACSLVKRNKAQSGPAIRGRPTARVECVVKQTRFTILCAAVYRRHVAVNGKTCIVL